MPPVRSATPLRLVLVVGRDLQPDSQLRDTLARDGLRCLWLADLHQALQALRSARIDAMVVDRATLVQPGAPALQELTSASPCPVIAAGGATTEVDDLLALSCGATAFLTQPYSAERLLAQLNALIRISDGGLAASEAKSARSGAVISAADWQVDRVGNLLHREGRQVALTNVQSALLHTLLTADQRLVSRGQLAAALPRGTELSHRAIDVYVSRLRRRLAQAGVDDLFISTVVGRGYRVARQQQAFPSANPIKT